MHMWCMCVCVARGMCLFYAFSKRPANSLLCVTRWQTNCFVREIRVSHVNGTNVNSFAIQFSFVRWLYLSKWSILNIKARREECVRSWTHLCDNNNNDYVASESEFFHTCRCTVLRAAVCSMHHWHTYYMPCCAVLCHSTPCHTIQATKNVHNPFSIHRWQLRCCCACILSVAVAIAELQIEFGCFYSSCIYCIDLDRNRTVNYRTAIENLFTSLRFFGLVAVV